ncbi:OpgC domain-containing protein [Gordonia sp. VNQ95]|uniref:OpgC domain-containing protein n=1 Tax=Gordonia sp. VNQ95 TaxID=3156619 RepID=UPI0032B62666
MNRDLAIDVTRGLAIWSMITAHFADGAKIAMPTHAFPYVDGMSVFVLVSGFILGLVHHGWIDAHGMRFAFGKLAARLAVLYVCQLTIALVAVAAGMAGYFRLTWLLPVDGWAEGIWASVTMAYLPSGGNILLMYMVLMASAFAVLPLLARGWWAAVVAASIGLYVLAQTNPPDWFYLTADMTAPRIQNWAAWQVLFVPALAIGWNWRRWHLATRIERHLPLLVLVAATVAAAMHFLVIDGPLAAFEPALGDKLDLGVARVVGAWVVVPVVYGVFRVFLAQWHRDWLRPLALSGSRSLDSYVIQSLGLVVVPIMILDRPWSTWSMTVIAVGVFGACWAWAEFRRACHVDKLHRLPAILAAPITTAIARKMPAPAVRPVGVASAATHSSVRRSVSAGSPS